VRILLKLFATLGERLPAELAPGAAVQEVIDRFQLPAGLVHLVLVNGVYVPPAQRASRRLVEGDALAIWPPVAGG